MYYKQLPCMTDYFAFWKQVEVHFERLNIAEYTLRPIKARVTLGASL